MNFFSRNPDYFLNNFKSLWKHAIFQCVFFNFIFLFFCHLRNHTILKYWNVENSNFNSTTITGKFGGHWTGLGGKNFFVEVV